MKNQNDDIRESDGCLSNRISMTVMPTTSPSSYMERYTRSSFKRSISFARPV